MSDLDRIVKVRSIQVVDNLPWRAGQAGTLPWRSGAMPSGMRRRLISYIFYSSWRLLGARSTGKALNAGSRATGAGRDRPCRTRAGMRHYPLLSPGERQLDASARAGIGVPGKTRRRRGLLPARRSNAAWRGERGAGGCAARSLRRCRPSQPQDPASMRSARGWQAVNCRF